MKKLLLLTLLSANCYATKWQVVTNNSWTLPDCFRLEVPHGWIVSTRISTGTSTIFYPDEKHEWKINND